LEVDPRLAHHRIVARGTDAESLDDLAAFERAYRHLPEYNSFLKVDASLPPRDVSEQILRVVSGRRWPRPSDRALR
ncbi:MAG TPA: thymidylate kinase, partial [Arthrobacter sp.]|nr:thymidylate kinase [Arthrobacter sp.]